jgi:putative hydrolase of the HAD superfamily
MNAGHPPTALRAVYFDLDRTLLDRDTSVVSFASAQFEAFRARLDGVARDAFVNAFIRLDARGSVWKDLVYQRLTLELGVRSVSWEELFADFDARIAQHYVPFPGMHETLRELARHYRLGLISNGRTEFQNRTITQLNLSSYFSVILISEAEGVRKPDREIFHRALSRLDITPAEAAYVGDHPLTDMRAAREVGMWAIWKRNADFAEAACDDVIDDLRELPLILRKQQHRVSLDENEA